MVQFDADNLRIARPSEVLGNIKVCYFHSLPVGVGVFLRRENPEFAILAAILETTRRGEAGRAIVDKEAMRGEGAGYEKKEGKNAYWITIPL